MVFQLFHHKVVGSIGVNFGRDMRFARTLIASGNTKQSDMLVSNKLKLQDLFR
jgi:hypothetical protein